MEFIFAFLIFIIVVLCMAIGVILQKKRLKGSCGGLSNIGIDRECDCEDICEEEGNLYQIDEPSDHKSK